MIHWTRKRKMDLETATKIVKWDVYCSPAPTNAEFQKAWEIVRKHKNVDLRWSK